MLMGSPSDLSHCEKIKKSCANFGIPCELRVTSAHKGPDETLRIKSEYEGKPPITMCLDKIGNFAKLCQESLFYLGVKCHRKHSAFAN